MAKGTNEHFALLEIQNFCVEEKGEKCAQMEKRLSRTLLYLLLVKMKKDRVGKRGCVRHM